jgi:tetratricopeptide (TPR) repeat protein
MTEAGPMPTDRVVRVFVSSTFLDMHEEREELVKRVFPRLRRLCEDRGVTWGEVDLRWGITDEERAEGKVLPVCLAEIRGCRPYFIGLLGERYGWVPDEIPAPVLDIEPWLAGHLGCSVTELEILHGVLDDPAMAGHSFFYFRDPAFVDALPAAERPKHLEGPLPEERERLGDAEAERRAAARRDRLADLKQRIRRSGLPVREGYRDAKDLGVRVLEDLTRVIERRFPEGSEPTPLDREAAAHEAFARSRSAVYVRRPEDFERLDRHAAEEGPPLVLVGDSGVGKSALLAAWADDYRERHRDAVVLAHFIGATADSTDWSATVRRLVGELDRRLGLGIDVPDEPDALRRAFQDVIDRAPRESRVVLLLDGLNQLEDREGALDLEWLPRELPPAVHLVVSCLPGRALEALGRRGWPTWEVEPLDVDRRRRLIHAYLDRHRKRLAPERVDRIAAAPQSANPLYLRSLLEELRLWGRHETLEAAIGHYLTAATPTELFDRILARHEEDYEDDRPGLVANAMSLLWAARRGLSTAELLDLLGAHGSPLPGAHWSPFHLAIQASLVDRSGLLAFSHDHLRQAVAARYVPSEADRRRAHLRLATYFQRQPIGPRMVEELAWQTAEAGEWDGLTILLGFDPYLAAAWKGDAGKLDVRRLWTRLEATGRTIESAYGEVIARPGERPLTAAIVRDLLAGVGRVEAALELDRRLLEFYRSAEFGDQVAARVERAGREGADDVPPGFLAQAQLRMVGDRLERMAHALLQQEELGQALETLQQAEAIWNQLGDRESLARCYALQADVHMAGKDLRAAEPLYERAEALFRDHGAAAEVTGVRLSRSRLLHARGRLQEALELAQMVERERRARGDLRALAIALSDIGLILHQMGDPTRAIAAFNEAARIDSELGDRRSLANVLVGRAASLARSGDRSAALDVWGEAEVIARNVGDRRTLADCLYNQAQELSRDAAGRARAAEKCAEARRLFAELGDRPSAMQAAGLLAQIQMGYRQAWKGWVGLGLVGLAAAAAVAAGFRSWWWWLLGGPLALLWLQAVALALVPGYRGAVARFQGQLGADLRRMDDEERRDANER